MDLNNSVAHYKETIQESQDETRRWVSWDTADVFKGFMNVKQHQTGYEAYACPFKMFQQFIQQYNTGDFV